MHAHEGAKLADNYADDTTFQTTGDASTTAVFPGHAQLSKSENYNTQKALPHAAPRSQQTILLPRLAP
jgi:hypothetical protein